MHDVISRGAAVKEMERIALQVGKDKIRTVAKCVNALELLPSLDAAPSVHAMWKGGFCTACGCEAPRTKPIGDHAYRVPTMYCPDCGAKMDAKEDL